MEKTKPLYIPVKGKTYSFFGNDSSTEQYFIFIDNLVEVFLQYYDIEKLNSSIRNNKTIDNFIKLFFKEYSREINTDLHRQFEVYTNEVKNHLKNLSLSERFDKTLRTKQKQYHFYMLECEIVNRINRAKFKQTGYKIGLLPHCLRDTNKNCRAQTDGIDLVCKHCSRECFINFASRILKENNVNPYIWIDLEEKQLYRKKIIEYGSIGVFGMACIPELVNGMRRCIKRGIPVIGIPLNANRCRRWMGDYYENSFCMERLRALF